MNREPRTPSTSARRADARRDRAPFTSTPRRRTRPTLEQLAYETAQLGDALQVLNSNIRQHLALLTGYLVNLREVLIARNVLGAEDLAAVAQIAHLESLLELPTPPDGRPQG